MAAPPGDPAPPDCGERALSDPSPGMEPSDPDGSPGSSPSDVFAAPPAEAAPVIALIGRAALTEALREAGVDRVVFHGFRPGPKILDHPLIRRRLADALAQSRVQAALSARWNRDAGPLHAALSETVTGADIERLSRGYDRAVLEWAVFLQGDPALRTLLATEDSAENALVDAARDSADDSEVSTEVSDAGPEPTPGNDRSPLEPEPDAASCVPAPCRSERPESPADSPPHPDEARLGAARRELLSGQKREQALERESNQLKRRIEAGARKADELLKRAEHAEAEARSAARQVARLQKSLDEAAAKAAAAERAARRAESDRRAEADRGAGSSSGKKAATGFKDGAAAPVSRRGGAVVGAAATGQVVLKLLERGRHDAVIEFSKAFLELEPDSEEAKKWLLESLVASGRREDAARLHYDAAARAFAESNHQEALRALTASILAAPESPDVSWRLEKLIQTADPASTADVEQAAALYATLKQNSPHAARSFESLARRLRRSLWRRLPAARITVNRTLTIEWTVPGGTTKTSASELAAAVSSGDLELVAPFRKWAASQHGDARQKALEIIDGANTHVPGARRVLTGTTRPVLVDGSNVAWYGCPSGTLADAENIRAVRHALFEHGYFPVTVLADAALPFQVGDREVIHRWELRGEILLVERNTDADEALVLEARRAGIPIVTNDKLRDVDPEGRCARIGFSIAPGGVTLTE